MDESGAGRSEKALVAVSGKPDWLEQAIDALQSQPCTIAPYDSAADLVSRLADDRAAMLLVDAARADWQRWVVLTCTDPATRRIPVVVITEDPGLSRMAIDSGAAAVVTLDDMAEGLLRLLAARARVMDPADRAALECQCAESLPPEGLEGVRQFNRGAYYRQHDLFEALWMRETGPVRDLYHAILQVGVAYYQIQRGNHRGALKMLLRSVQWLAPLPDVCQGVDVARLRTDSAQVRQALEALDPARMADFDMRLLRPVRLVGQADDDSRSR